MCIYTYIYIYIYINVYELLHASFYLCADMYVCVPVYTWYVLERCMCNYIHIGRNKHLTTYVYTCASHILWLHYTCIRAFGIPKPQLNELMHWKRAHHELRVCVWYVQTFIYLLHPWNSCCEQSNVHSRLDGQLSPMPKDQPMRLKSQDAQSNPTAMPQHFAGPSDDLRPQTRTHELCMRNCTNTRSMKSMSASRLLMATIDPTQTT